MKGLGYLTCGMLSTPWWASSKTAFGTALVPALTELLGWGKRLIDEWVKPFLGGIEIMQIRLSRPLERRNNTLVFA